MGGHHYRKRVLGSAARRRERERRRDKDSVRLAGGDNSRRLRDTKGRYAAERVAYHRAGQRLDYDRRGNPGDAARLFISRCPLALRSSIDYGRSPPRRRRLRTAIHLGIGNIGRRKEDARRRLY